VGTEVVTLDIEVTEIPEHPGQLADPAFTGVSRKPEHGPEYRQRRPKAPARNPHLVQVLGIGSVPDPGLLAENPAELFPDGLGGGLPNGDPVLARGGGRWRPRQSHSAGALPALGYD
jgi:hypothetical protein